MGIINVTLVPEGFPKLYKSVMDISIGFFDVRLERLILSFMMVVAQLLYL